LFDAVSYLILLFMLSKINLREIQRSTVSLSKSRWESLIEGFSYIRNSSTIAPRVSQLFLTIALMVPLMMVVFRTYVQTKFNLTAEEFGYIFTLPSLGSMMGALSFTFVKPTTPIKALW